MKTFMVSDCCHAKVDVIREGGGTYDPPFPRSYCTRCWRKCDIIQLTKDELIEESHDDIRDELIEEWDDET
jgi:hypothetical protein